MNTDFKRIQYTQFLYFKVSSSQCNIIIFISLSPKVNPCYRVASSSLSHSLPSATVFRNFPAQRIVAIGCTYFPRYHNCSYALYRYPNQTSHLSYIDMATYGKKKRSILPSFTSLRDFRETNSASKPKKEKPKIHGTLHILTFQGLSSFLYTSQFCSELRLDRGGHEGDLRSKSYCSCSC